MTRHFVLLVLSTLLGWVQVQADVTCPAKNGYFPDATQCDKYVKCVKGVGEEITCEDGLLVNEEAAAFRNPCDYFVHVDCGNRKAPPAAPAVGNCQRKNGMFPKIGGNCGEFVNCIDSREYDFKCPEGLAWHPTKWLCDWADQVETCNAEEYLGFKCPDSSAVNDDPRYPHPKDCARFFVCIGGTKPRLHVCGDQTVFNKATGSCDDPVNVPECANYYPPLPKKTA